MSDPGNTAANENPSILPGQEEKPRRAMKPRHPVRRVVLILLAVVLVSVLGYGGYYLLRVNQAMDNLERSETLMPPDESRPPEASANPNAEHDPVTYVLMGSDSRGEDQGRSDTLMVAYLTGDRKNVYLVSFPRDMWVQIPGHGEAKINAAYAFGGPQLTIRTLESLVETRMEHAVSIDFNGFIALTTLLGGVTVNNQHASSSDGYDFPAGEITISGEQALAYVRERYGLPQGDLDRAERQRQVATAIIGKLTTPEILANPNLMGDILNKLADTMTVDSGLSNAEIYNTARQLGFSGTSGVRSLQAPILGFGTSADGQSIDIVDHEKLKELATAMQTDTMDAYYQKHIK